MEFELSLGFNAALLQFLLSDFLLKPLLFLLVRLHETLQGTILVALNVDDERLILIAEVSNLISET